jgi:hypothetical protein
MHRLRHPAGIATLAALVCLLTACQQQSQTVTMEQKFGPAQLTVTQIQQEVMAYADTLATRVAEASDDVRDTADDPSVRVSAHAIKTSTALAAFTIASEQSPIAALLDMVVLVTLSYEVSRDLWIPMLFGEAGRPIVDAFAVGQEEIWELADRVLEPDGREQLEGYIRQWREEHPNQKYVSHVRLRDFADVRAALGSAASGQGGNLLGLFMLDPLSKMTPATRQIEQSRLLGERLFYFASRLPVLMSWEAESLVYEVMDEPETQRLLENANRYAEVGQRLTELAEVLPDEVAARVAVEREALIDQTGAMIARERDTAIEQARRAIATERTAFLEDLNRQADALGPLVTELRAALDSGTALSNSIDGIVTKVQARRPEDAEPLEMADVRASLVEATAAARELTTLTESLDRLLASSEPGRLAELQETLALTEAAGNRLVNRIFVLALALVGVIFVASLVKALIRAPAARGGTSTPPAK